MYKGHNVIERGQKWTSAEIPMEFWHIIACLEVLNQAFFAVAYKTKTEKLLQCLHDSQIIHFERP